MVLTKGVKLKVILISLLITFSMGLAAKSSNDLPTASNVEVQRYVGKWNAISSLPQFFTRKCVAQTAEYQIIGEGEISVLNTCIKEHDRETTIDGQAKVVNSVTNAELVVTFNNFWTRLFRVKGDYIIIKLDQDYEYVLVGSPNRKSLWIMSREESMPTEVYNEYLNYAKSLGFDTDKLVVSKF